MFDTRLSQKLAWHWYDFVCPFCYVGLSRSQLLARRGFHIVNLPLQVFPNVLSEGAILQYSRWPEISVVEKEIAEYGLQMTWPTRIPNTRRALAVSEWTRRNAEQSFAGLFENLFLAHFVRNEDIGDPEVVDHYALNAGLDLKRVHLAISDGTAFGMLEQSEAAARRHGVQAAPAWAIGKRLVPGLLQKTDFDEIADLYALGTGDVDHQMQCLIDPVKV